MIHDDDYLPTLSVITVNSSDNIFIKTNDLVKSPSNADAELTIRRSYNLEYQKSLETFTFEDSRFDPENTLDWPD